jgi:hypothetical protein
MSEFDLDEIVEIGGGERIRRGDMTRDHLRRRRAFIEAEKEKRDREFARAMARLDAEEMLNRRR